MAFIAVALAVFSPLSVHIGCPRLSLIDERSRGEKGNDISEEIIRSLLGEKVRGGSGCEKGGKTEVRFSHRAGSGREMLSEINYTLPMRV